MPRRTSILRPAPAVLALLVAAGLAACSSASPGPAPGRAAAPVERTRGPAVGDERLVRASEVPAADRERFAAAWRLFVTHDPRWDAARDAWLARGGAAPYLLAENLFRYFWSASRAARRDEVLRVADEAQRVGEPAVAYFAKALVTDRWPLGQPVTVEVFNPDNIDKPLLKTFTHYDIDDVTRQHAAQVLARIGPPAVPTLVSPAVLQSALPSARRYGAYALGAIATDDAVRALGGMVAGGGTWQDRGAAAKALGFALPKNPQARPYLEQATRDPDDFVRRKAEEGLSGKTRIEF
jgi:hypothetical protein